MNNLLPRCLLVLSLLCGMSGCWLAPPSPASQSAYSLDRVFSDPKAQALALAAEQGNAAEVRRLMKEEKVDPDHIFGADGMPLLAWPVFTESPQGLRAMLENGADPNARNPKQIVKTYKDGSVGRYFVSENAMVLAAQKEDPIYLRLLLDHGGDPNTRNGNDESLLFHALIHQNKQKNVKLLVERGARVNDLAGMGGTVLELYTSRGGFEISYWLLQHGADPSLVYEYEKPVHRMDSHMVQSMFWYPAPPISSDWQRKCQLWLLQHGYKRPPLSEQYRKMRQDFGVPSNEQDVPLPLK